MVHDTQIMPSSQYQKILGMLQLDINILQDFDVFCEGGHIHINVTLKKKMHSCPICSSATATTHSYVVKKIRHSVLHTAPCTIHYRARRYVCSNCRKTFYENNPFSFDGEHSSAATVYCVLSDLKSPQETFRSIGQRYHMSASTVISIFDRHVDIPRLPLPRILSIDEVYVPTDEGNKYLCVLMNFETMEIVDVLPSRKKAALIAYFSGIPRDERCNVEIVSADLWISYHDVASFMLPSCHTSVDKFHLLMELSRQISTIRIKTMKYFGHIKKHYFEEKKKRKLAPDEEFQYRKACMSYYSLKKFNWLFYTSNQYYFDPNTKKKYNKVFQKYMNYLDIYDHMIHCNEDLEKALFLKDDFETFFKTCTYDDAGEALDNLIRDFKASHIDEMKHFAGTLAQWRNEIINSFIPINSDNELVNNSRIESVNKKIKTLKRCANGYRSFSRLRNRIMYVCNRNATYSLSPIKRKENKK